MDGTLWDAVDTYVLAWNKAFQNKGIAKTITRQDLQAIMGWERSKVIDHFFAGMPAREQAAVFESIVALQDELIATQGGVLYDGVREGLALLAQYYPLFMVSNCPKDTIQHFLQWSGLSPFITDEMAHGVNNMPKHHNIKLLMEKHHLKQPFYIGDTDGDREASELAGVPFVFVGYGFGQTTGYYLAFDNFTALANFFAGIKIKE